MICFSMCFVCLSGIFFECCVVGDLVCLWGWGEDGQFGYGDVEERYLFFVISVFDDCEIFFIICGVDYIIVCFEFIRIVYSWGW